MLVRGTTSIAPSDQGGCRAVYYLADVEVGDQCGPHAFVLDAPAVVVAPGETLTFSAPVAWVFSSGELGGRVAWSVTVAPVEVLEDLGEGEQESIPPGRGARVIGTGRGPAARVEVEAPTERGEYLVQLAVDLARDGWTFADNRYFWRISVR